MAQVTVTVNGREYIVGCGEGEESHILNLAEYIDQRVRKLSDQVGQVGEARLLLLASLYIADDLSGLYDKIDDMQKSGRVDLVDPAILGDYAARLESVADRLENP